MRPPSSLSSRSWVVVLLLAAAFVVWSSAVQIRRAEYVTGIGQEAPPVAADSPTGYAGGTRELIVPEHIDVSYEWIAQTQQMFARGEWRVREVDCENAPFGRPVYLSSPYRWWLGAVAWTHHVLFGRPIGFSVERAALVADPLLHLLLLGATTIFVARRFGSMAASVTAVGLVALFPFGAGFLPAVPEDYGVLLGLSLWSVLPLVVGMRLLGADEPTEAPARRTRRARFWFGLAGVMGGLSLWISVVVGVPLLVGAGLGALLSAWALRREPTDVPAGAPPWGIWGLAGGLTVLVASLIEYFPAHLGEWELRVIHPLYGIGWLGGAALLILATAWIQRTKTKWSIRDFALGLAGAAGAAAVPVAMWKTGNAGFLAINLLAFRLTKQMDGVLAPNLGQWLSRDRLSLDAAATLLPVWLLAAGLGLFWLRKNDRAGRAALAAAIGPALVALGFSWFQLRWWQVADGLLLVLAVCGTALFAGASVRRRALWLGALAATFALGMARLTPLKGVAAENVLSLSEVEGLVERDLAHWLAKRSGATPVVLAPPSVTATLCFHGGMRGLGTFAWESKDGLAAALRIVISTSREEAEALIRRRGVTHLVLPSWDRFFEDYTRPASVQAGEMFYTGLHRWSVPPWLRPIPFQLPKISGFGEQSVVIFEVVDEQAEPVALGRTAEYFVEMGDPERALAVAQALKRFPADLGALVARAQVEVGVRNTAGFSELLETIVKRVAAGGDRVMPWDRRVSLAVIFARGQRMDLARVQMQRCLAEINEARLRSLTPYSLLHFETLRGALGLEAPAEPLRAVTRGLLP